MAFAPARASTAEVFAACTTSFEVICFLFARLAREDHTTALRSTRPQSSWPNAISWSVI